jgi:hypothetical protein
VIESTDFSHVEGRQKAYPLSAAAPAAVLISP